ncbi:MAG: PD40 domain-containing protein, partial [Verrucomicrobia bacterium]|nr:PD40 domain-containing protein [Cytophagales bacterium]
MLRYLTIISLVFANFQLLSAQDLKKKIAEGDKWFNIRDYKKALPIYLDVLKVNPNDPETNYATGVCYFETGEKLKSLPHFQIASKAAKAQIPADVNLYFGKALHLNKEYDEATVVLNKYKTLEKNPVRIDEANRFLLYCKNAKIYDKVTVEVFIQNIGSPINTANTEYGPVIKADESVLIYTSLKPVVAGKTQSFGNKGVYEELMTTQKDAVGAWGNPQTVNLNVPSLNGMRSNVGSVGLSPDGQKLLVYIGNGANTGEIYASRLQGDKWESPVKLGSEVNLSNAEESSASLSGDERIMYFASNRPGGLGGRDIYRVEKVNGVWGKPVNLGPTVNSKYDEEAPFIHPDGKTLYFSSNGPSSMGALDVFKVEIEPSGKVIGAIENMGFPINTVYNDCYFVLSADGKKGYFASDRPGGLGGLDLYFLGIPEEQGVVPLTLMKGRILAGDPPIAVPTKIKIIDNETKEVIKDVYQPNAKTGNYLVVFQPSRSYDLVIEAQGYKPSLVNIYVPNQNYFYELYQEIILTAVTKDGKVVGQGIAVKNVFTDVEKDNKNAKKDNAEVYALMNNLTSATDTSAM